MDADALVNWFALPNSQRYKRGEKGSYSNLGMVPQRLAGPDSQRLCTGAQTPPANPATTGVAHVLCTGAQTPPANHARGVAYVLRTGAQTPPANPARGVAYVLRTGAQTPPANPAGRQRQRRCTRNTKLGVNPCQQLHD